MDERFLRIAAIFMMIAGVVVLAYQVYVVSPPLLQANQTVQEDVLVTIPVWIESVIPTEKGTVLTLSRHQELTAFIAADVPFAVGEMVIITGKQSGDWLTLTRIDGYDSFKNKN